jgi:hypothetical protein
MLSLSLRTEIGIGQKTKRWQCGAWKDLKSNGYIGGTAKELEITKEGLALAASLASDEELEAYKMPETNEEHQEKIKQKLERNEKAKRYGPKIFDYMIEIHGDGKNAKTTQEIADYFHILADSHGKCGLMGRLAKFRWLNCRCLCCRTGFFYGFQALKKMGLVQSGGTQKRKKIIEKDAIKEDKTSEEGVEEGSDQEPPKKKKKSKGGKNCGATWKLSEKAFLASAF